MSTSDPKEQTVTPTEAAIAAQYEGYADVRSPEPYKPNQRAGMWAATPQSRPHLFTDAEIKLEIKYLLGLNKRHGSHELRTMSYLRLMKVLKERAAVYHCPKGTAWCGETNAIHVACDVWRHAR